ncbi:ketopantoate reductase family protein [Vulgatibacter sp.]|uniref:ketopantoate reductase family protein n=1 Tax=Vulgatibacter sp. TaxID=1971226 RepID=UPI003562BD46
MKRLLVVGCGGIGGVIAATLAEQQVPLAVVARGPIAEALHLRGFDLRDEKGRRLVRGPVEVHESQPPGPFDFVLLAVPPDRLEEAARAALPSLGPDGALVCLQNGLAEERLAAAAGVDRVVGAVVAWGASAPEAGVYERTSSGGFTLGRLDGAADPRLDSLASLLEHVGPVRITENLRGARWSKLALNCAVSSLGVIGGDRVGALLRFRFVRRLALEVMSEAVAVAEAEGARLERIAGTVDLQWIALTEAERAAAAGTPTLLAKHGLLLAVGARYRRLRSSMLAAIERGRVPPVDFLNGEVVERGVRHGIDAPVNRAIVELVHAIARREERSGLAALERLYQQTRAGRRAA